MLIPMAIDREPDAPNAQISAADISKDALPDAVRTLGDVSKNEETRFSNLNSRAIALVSATSIVTTLAGVFSKDLIGKDVSSVFSNAVRWIAIVGLTVALLLLLATALWASLGVLLPKQRYVFGDNDLLPKPGVTPNAIADAETLQRLVVSEYRTIATNLAKRNSRKASALNKSYACFLAAVITIGATAIIALIARLP